MEISFTPLHSWSLVPSKSEVDLGIAPEADPGLRYAAVGRHQQRCPPRKLLASSTWLVRSPVTVDLEPFDDTPIRVPESQDVQDVLRRLNYSFAVEIDAPAWLATRGLEWTRQFEFTDGAAIRSMFVPNGEQTLEWHLGWGMSLSEGASTMVFSTGSTAFDVHPAILTKRQVDAMSERGGLSIPIRIRERARVQRGDAIARLCVLAGESLRVRELTDRNEDVDE